MLNKYFTKGIIDRWKYKRQFSKLKFMPEPKLLSKANLEEKINAHIENGFQMDYDRADNLVPVFQKNEVIENIIIDIDSFCKQECIEFLKWYGVKIVGLVDYITKVKPIVVSDEIEERLQEFEGEDFNTLYTLYLQSKTQSNE